MAVYYQYDNTGALQSTSTMDPIMEQPFSHLDFNYYLERGDTVGAYLAQRATIYPDHPIPAAYQGEVPQNDGADDQDMEFNHDQHHADGCHHFEEQYESYGWDGNSHFVPPPIPIHMAAPLQHHGYNHYRNPDKIRHLYSLFGLLPLIDPVRRFYSQEGQKIDIVEEGTGGILYYAVPKKLLVLFLGKTTVGRLLVSPYSFMDGYEKIQRLVMPRGLSSRSAWTVLVSWMKRATSPEYADDIEQFRVPQNLFAACSLAQTLSFVGLHKDAYRVDMTISQQHLVRPVFAVELEALWRNLGPHNGYTWAAIEKAKKQLRDYGLDKRRQAGTCEDIQRLLDVSPEMAAFFGNEDEDQTSSPAAEKDQLHQQLDADPTAKTGRKAKVIRIVLESKKSDKSDEEEDTKEVTGGGDLA